MGLRRIIVLLIALVAAGGSAMYARSWIEGQQAVQAVAAPAPKEQVHEVLVADADLPAGSFVKPQHLRWQRWPTDDVPESYVLKGVRSDDEMIGAVVRRRIAIGEPLTDGAVVKPGERGFLAAVLEPGMRAVSVPVTPTSRNAGLIFPGDRVDLILTQSLVENEMEGSVRRVSETVLSDTGAWSLYSPAREADLGYHRLARDFLRSLCARLGRTDAARAAPYCRMAERFEGYLHQPPRLSLGLPAGRPRARP